MVKKNKFLITTKQLIKIQFPIGHKKSDLTKSMNPYIYGFRNRIVLFDLEKIIFSLKVVFNALKLIFSKRGMFFLASTQKNLPVYDFFNEYSKFKKANLTKEANIDIYGFMTDKWINGIFTNNFFYRKLMDIINSTPDEFLNSRNKKYKKYLRGVQEKYFFLYPDIAILFGHNENACKEFNNLRIPLIGLLDSNGRPEFYDYMIPGNDDSVEVLQFFFEFLEKAEKEGRFLECLIFYKLSVVKIKGGSKYKKRKNYKFRNGI